MRQEAESRTATTITEIVLVRIVTSLSVYAALTPESKVFEILVVAQCPLRIDQRCPPRGKRGGEHGGDKHSDHCKSQEGPV